MATAHLACLDGAVMPAAEAVVPATDGRLLRRPFVLEEHLRSCTLDELLAADEAFLVSTTRELQPVASVDGRAIGDGGPGPVSRDLAERLHRRVLADLG